jgi:chromosomal replication initiation ATPase DnaA
MAPEDNRKDLERRLEQASRMASEANDPLTKERIAQLIRDLQQQLEAPTGSRGAQRID